MEIYNFTTKYKDQTPENTIANIKKFFDDRRYEIRISGFSETEIGTWGCALDLYLNDDFILHSNGKGMTQEFAYASGLAEMYERFCAKHNIYGNPIVCKRYIDECYKLSGYYWHPEEKHVSLEDFRQHHSIHVKDFLAAVSSNFDTQQKWVDIAFPYGLIEVPFIGLNTDKPLGMDLRFLAYYKGSSGLAAGNTIEEALTQGLSEYCEHHVVGDFFRGNQEKFYYIDLDNIDNQELKDTIQAIRNANNEFYILDLSYNFGYPVLMSFLINKKSYTCSINFGSSPVFDIALERVITELYQNIFTFSYSDKLTKPLKDDLISAMCHHASCYGRIDENIAEYIMPRLTPATTYNSDVFLSSGNYDNKQLNKYFIDLANKNNLTIYYYDNSLTDNVAAVNIFIPELLPYWNKRQGLVKYTERDKEKSLSVLEAKINFVNKVLSNDLKYSDMLFILNLNYFYDVREVMETLLQCEPLMLYPHVSTGPMYVKLMTFFTNYSVLFNVGNLYNIQETYFGPNFKIALMIKYYLDEHYNPEQIKNILEVFDINLTEEEILKYNDLDYCAQKIIVEPTLQVYNSDTFTHYLLTHYKLFRNHE